MARVLILGGVGFIGRNFVKYLVDNTDVSYIRVTDKVLPATAYLGDFQQYFDNDKVEYKQGNLTNASSISKVFDHDEGFDYVFNLAGETKYGQTDEVYDEKVLKLSTMVAEEAAKRKVKLFIEVSSAQVYAAGSKSSDEKGSVKPWTGIARYKLKAEEALKAMDGLPLIIVRPAVVYGPGDITGITPRAVVAASYKKTGKKMKFLWTGSLQINTVHVRDVCKALWHLTSKGKPGDVYNLADKNQTDQKKINVILESIFGIKTEFVGKLKSNMAKTVGFKSVCDAENETNLTPWSELCREAGITNTPLSPYLDPELLYNNALSVDGSAIESTGFTYDHPNMTEELLREQLKYFVDQELFPSSVIG